MEHDRNGAGRVSSMRGSLARTGLPQAMVSATYNAANQCVGQDRATLTYDTTAT